MRHRDEQAADQDRGDRVEDVDPGDGREAEADRGEQVPDQRGGVLEEDELRRRVARAADELVEALVVGLGRGAGLAQRPQPRGPLGHDRQREDGEGDDQPLLGLAALEELVDAVADREGGAGDEHPDGGDERPQEALHARAEGALGRRLAARQADRDEQEALVGRVGDRVDGLGEHRARTGEQTAGELGHGDDRVGGQGDQDRAARAVVLAVAQDRAAARDRGDAAAEALAVLRLVAHRRPRT